MQKHAQVPLWFEWLFVIFASWQIIGAYIDGWAHIHLDTALETFFTPWHAVFYSGFAAVTGLLLLTLWKNHRQGYPWRFALPREYWISLAGAAIFMVAGVGDLLWHTLFGIEIGIEALLSPTHLLLAFGGVILVSGPLHAIWFRDVNTEKIHKGPVAVSLCLVLLTLTFMTQFLHPYYFPYVAAPYEPHGSFQANISMADVLTGVSIGNMLFFSIVLISMILAIIRFITLPTGSFTLLLGLEAIGMGFLRDQFWLIVPAVLAGIAVDILYHLSKHRLHETKVLRGFGFSVPAIVTAAYVLSVIAKMGTWWSIHLIAGTIVMAGIAGLLLTYLILPPGDHFIPRKNNW